jgi:hypothetical protein
MATTRAGPGSVDEQMQAENEAREAADAEYYDVGAQISRTYDGEEDVAALQKRRNAERQYRQAGFTDEEIPTNTGYVFIDKREPQQNVGAGDEVSQGEPMTKEVIEKEDANVENV